MQGLIQPKTMPMLKGKDVTGATGAVILATKYGGIQRPAKAEPWEAERLLMVSRYGALDSAQELEPFTWNLDQPNQKYEPGTVKFYIVLLPWRDSDTRPLGYTAIAKAHLASAPSFDALEDALEAYGDHA